MSNMGYCRFQNTALDLSDCRDALQELFDGDCEPLSDDELPAAERLVALCAEIVALAAGDDDVVDLGDRIKTDRALRAAVVAANQKAVAADDEDDEDDEDDDDGSSAPGAVQS